MKIIITDATYKHSLALAKYIKRYDRSIKIIGFIEGKPKNYFIYKILYKKYSNLIFGDLKTVLDSEDFDLIIPVGAHSVNIVAEQKTQKRVLPSLKSIKIALSKKNTLYLADELAIPIPQTLYLKSIKKLEKINIKFPCVIKGALEAGGSLVEYANNRNELYKYFYKIAKNKSQKGTLPIIQEYISGIGVGFFGFYQKGTLKRFYIHRRLREYPITGGPSTAAETFYHPKIFEYGKRILDKLHWNGVAMVEFKYNEKLDKLWLMEINPKFWGSTELGLASGVNFGELIIRSFKGEIIDKNYSEGSYKKIKFYWPLDGDLINIFENKCYKILLDYLRLDYKSNFWTNGIPLNMYKIIALLKRMIRK